MRMIEYFAHGKLRWINMKRPTAEEIKKVMTELDLPPFLMSDLSTPIPRNRAQLIDGTIKLTLDFPTVKHIDVEHPYEVKFIISKNSLVTVQYEEMAGIDRFKRQFEVAATLRKKQKHLTGAHLFISLINALYESAFTKLDYLESQLSDIESKIFKHYKQNMVFEISDISKKLISFRHILRGHEDVFREARPLFDNVYGDTFSIDLQNIQGQFFLLLRHTNTLFDTLIALRETNTAMITTRQNEIIKNLTIMAFITYPLTLISSMFGMNTEWSPIVGTKGDFWIIFAIMFSIAFVFFLFFRHQRWM
jgi:magnesium transporter